MGFHDHQCILDSGSSQCLKAQLVTQYAQEDFCKYRITFDNQNVWCSHQTISLPQQIKKRNNRADGALQAARISMSLRVTEGTYPSGGRGEEILTLYYHF